MDRSYCYSCMSPLQNGVCPHGCPPVQNDPYMLQPGTLLNQNYLIGRSLGQGGFGITYLGRDLMLNTTVAIKEFYPSGVASRDTSVSQNIQVAATETRESLNRQKEKFLAEARTLARFRDEPGIVRIWNSFPANETIYIVMEYIEGETLEDFLNKNGPMSLEQVRALFAPVFRSLTRLHESGLIHRDISPDNIMRSRDGHARLRDFGTVRDVALSGDRSMSVVIKTGYAPLEQYSRRGRQGPWTDVYGLAATIYRCITGVTPEDATERIGAAEDPRQAPSALGVSISPGQEAVLLKALDLRYQSRWQSVQSFVGALDGAGPAISGEAPDIRNTDAAVRKSESGKPDDRGRNFTGKESESGKPDGPGRDSPGDERHTVYVPSDQGRPDHIRTDSSGSSEQHSSAETGEPEDGGKSERAGTDPSGKAQSAPEKDRAGKSRNLVGDSAGGKDTGKDKDKDKDKGRGRGRVRVRGPGRSAGPEDDASKPGDAVSPDASAGGDQTRKKKKPGRKGLGKRIALGALIVVVVVLAASVVFRMANTVTIGGETYTTDDTHATLTRLTVTPEMVHDLEQLGTIQSVSLFNCEVSDEVLETFAGMSGVDFLRFSECTGFTSLDPLSAMRDLTDLTLSSQDVPSCSVPFTQVDHLTLSSLSGLDSLDLLRQFPNLTFLYISLTDTKITDFSPIGDLHSLTQINLSDTGIQDLSFVETLPALQVLDAGNDHETEDTPFRNTISDLSPLAACPDLTELKLRYNAVSSLHGLENCTKLRTLELSGNAVTSLEPLSGCADLCYAYLDSNQLTSLDGLEAAKELYVLVCSDNQISSLEPLSGTQDMLQLTADHNQISSLQPMAGNTKLTTLNVAYNMLTSLAGCENMLRLKTLTANDNQITDLNGISNCTVLETVQLSWNQLSDLSVLGKNTESLTGIEAVHNSISTLDGLETCAGLMLLNCGENQISDLTPLSGLTNLAALRLANNQISSLNPLENLTSLAYLDLAGNSISDITPLRNSIGMSYVDLSSNQITDISPLSNLNGKYSASDMVADIDGFALNLEHNQIRDLSGLPLDVTYARLCIQDNPIETWDRVAELKFTRWPSEAGGLAMTWTADLDLTLLSGCGSPRWHVLDTPLDRQVSVEDTLRDGPSKTVLFETAQDYEQLLLEEKPVSVNPVGPEEPAAEEPVPET